MAISSIIFSIHKQEEKIKKSFQLQNDFSKDVEALIEKYVEKHPNGRLEQQENGKVLLCLPKVCGGKLSTKTEIIVNNNDFEYLCSTSFLKREQKPYLIVAPGYERMQEKDLREIFLLFYENKKKFLMPKEFFLGLFTKKINIKPRDEYLIPSGEKSFHFGDLEKKKKMTIATLSKKIKFKEIYVPICKERIFLSS